MKRSNRRKVLRDLERYIKTSGKSRSRIAFELSCNYNPSVVERIKTTYKNIHPWDYKNKYPLAVDVITRICYPKKRDDWGRKVELKQDLTKTLCQREGELLRRFRGLVRKSRKDEGKTLKLLDDILDMGINLEVREKLMETITPKDSMFYDTIKLLLLLNYEE